MGNESPKIGLVACCWMLQDSGLVWRGCLPIYLSPIPFVPSANIEGCLPVTARLYFFFFFFVPIANIGFGFVNSGKR